jgi:hypothetical protein
LPFIMASDVCFKRRAWYHVMNSQMLNRQYRHALSGKKQGGFW